jgi:hypothetical protein
MSHESKKGLADEVIQRSIELFGLTPDEISRNNVEWMRKNGYKKPVPEDKIRIINEFKEVQKPSKVHNLLRRLGLHKT